MGQAATEIGSVAFRGGWGVGGGGGQKGKAPVKVKGTEEEEKGWPRRFSSASKCSRAMLTLSPTWSRYQSFVFEPKSHV